MGPLETLRFFTFPTARMRELARPTIEYESLSDIDFRMFGSKHLITDWDGVWVSHNGILSQENEEKLEEAIESCASFSVLSNCSPKREAELAGTGIRIYRAVPKKPNPTAFARVLKELGLTPLQIANDAVYLGDRYYTDILGANAVGIGTVIRVKPINSNEPLGVRIVRRLEDSLYSGHFSQSNHY